MLRLGNPADKSLPWGESNANPRAPGRCGRGSAEQDVVECERCERAADAGIQGIGGARKALVGFSPSRRRDGE
jgi:hypothetical protein